MKSVAQKETASEQTAQIINFPIDRPTTPVVIPDARPTFASFEIDTDHYRSFGFHEGDIVIFDRDREPKGNDLVIIDNGRDPGYSRYTMGLWFTEDPSTFVGTVIARYVPVRKEAA